MIVAATSQSPYNLSTKLTGAGGGGCAVTLIPDTFPESTLDDLIRTLRNDGFEPYVTTLGGPGLGVLKTKGKESVSGKGEDEGVKVAVRVALREVSRDGVGKWAEGLGQWVHT